MATFSLLSYKVPRKVHAVARSGSGTLAERILALAVVFPLTDQFLPQSYSMGVHDNIHLEPVWMPPMPMHLCTPCTMQECGALQHSHTTVQYRGYKEKEKELPATTIGMQEM